MSTTASSFYQTGGTLSLDAPSYVARLADEDLYQGLSRGEFCYVLTSRQMGKSSLMARTAHRLREEGVAVAILDLTGIGQNLSPEQWYDGLLTTLGRQLDSASGSSRSLDDELDDFWLDHPRLGPLQRWLAALQQVVLKRDVGRPASVGEARGQSEVPVGTDDRRPMTDDSKIVIFIDEIDTVRSLPFSTDV